MVYNPIENLYIYLSMGIPTINPTTIIKGIVSGDFSRLENIQQK